MTIMLQAGFILVLCASFYQVISFYTRTQQVLTARNHAERVISVMDDKIRNAGLGLWRCGNSEAIRAKLTNIAQLATNDTKGYKLPVSLKWLKDGLSINKDKVPKLSLSQNAGDVLTLLYAQRDLSSGDENEVITAFREAKTLAVIPYTNIDVRETFKLLDLNNSKPYTNLTNLQNNSLFKFDGTAGNIKNYAVMEGVGIPLYLENMDVNSGQITVKVFNTTNSETITVPAAGELLAINCMQMFVHTHEKERQFAYRALKDDGTGWNDTYNQEKGILDIYMEVDRDKNIFTLWVLATGGYDASMNNPRPDTWPEKANWDNDYSHHIVYVSRATWKLNNIPQNFTWN